MAKRDILCTFVHSNITDKNVDGLQTCTDSNEIGVKGSLNRNLIFRKESIKPSPFVLNVLEHGYVLPLTSIPPPFIAKNNQSALKYPVFVDEAIKELLKYGYIEELSEPAYCCNPLTVADKGKLRLVLDLRHVNAYINVKKFRYEDLKVVTELFEENDYFVSFDLTSGYFHIDIHPEHRKYLGFRWSCKGKERFFQYGFLAGYVFSKVMRPLTKRWRGGGIKSIIFLDDGIAPKSSKQLAEEAAVQMETDLTRAGFAINREKSDFIPKQRGKWLGIMIDTKNMIFSVPEENF